MIANYVRFVVNYRIKFKYMMDWKFGNAFIIYSENNNFVVTVSIDVYYIESWYNYIITAKWIINK